MGIAQDTEASIDQSRARRIGLEIAVLSFFVLTSVLLTAPVVEHLDRAMIGPAHHPSPPQELFLSQVFVDALRHGRWAHPYRTHDANFPIGQDLGTIIGPSLNLYLYWPLAFIDNPRLRTNLLIIAIFTLNGYVGFRFFRRLFGRWDLALASAVFFQANPYVMLKANQVFIQKIAIFWIPAFWGAFLDILSRKRVWADGLRAGLIWGGQFLYYPQAGVYMGVFAATALLAIGIEEPGRILATIRCWLAALAALVAALLVFFLVYQGPSLAGILSGNEFRYPISPTGAIDLALVFRQNPYRGFPLKVDLFVGISVTLTALAVWGIRRTSLRVTRPYVLFAAVFFILALGDQLLIGGNTVLPLMPMRLLRALPMAGELGFSMRCLPFYFFPASVLAGYGMKAIMADRPRWARAIPFAAVVLFAVECRALLPETYPIHATVHEDSKVVTALRTGEKGAVLHVPSLWRPEYFESCVDTGRECVNIYRAEADYFPNAIAGEFPAVLAGEESWTQAVCSWSGRGVHWIDWHRDIEDAEQQLLVERMPALGEPVEVDGGEALYRIDRTRLGC